VAFAGRYHFGALLPQHPAVAGADGAAFAVEADQGTRRFRLLAGRLIRAVTVVNLELWRCCHGYFSFLRSGCICTSRLTSALSTSSARLQPCSRASRSRRSRAASDKTRPNLTFLWPLICPQLLVC